MQRLMYGDVDTAIQAESDGHAAPRHEYIGQADAVRRESAPGQVLHQVRRPSRLDLRTRVRGDHAERFAAGGQPALDARRCVFDDETARRLESAQLCAEQVWVRSTR